MARKRYQTRITALALALPGLAAGALRRYLAQPVNRAPCRSGRVCAAALGRPVFNAFSILQG